MIKLSMKFSKGIIGISSLIGLVVLAVALPLLGNLAQKPQDTRNLATEEKEDCKGAATGTKYCTGGSSWKVCGKTETGSCTSPMECNSVTGGGIKCSCAGGIAWGGKWCVGELIAECGPDSTPKKCSVGTCLGVAGSAYCGGSGPEKEKCPTGKPGDRFCDKDGIKGGSWKQCDDKGEYISLKGTCASDLTCEKGYCSKPEDEKYPCKDKDGASIKTGQSYCCKPGATAPYCDGEKGTWKVCGDNTFRKCADDMECKYGATGAGAECITAKTCKDAVSGNDIAGDGSSGCNTSDSYAACNNGVWGTPNSCSGKKCSGGKCNKEEPPVGNPCTDYESTKIPIGNKGCATEGSWATCIKGPTGSGIWATPMETCKEGYYCDKGKVECVKKEEIEPPVGNPCTDYESTKIPIGNKGCATEGSWATCIKGPTGSGIWATPMETCKEGYYCDKGKVECVEKTDTRPEPPKTMDCETDNKRIVKNGDDRACKNNNLSGVCIDGKWTETVECPAGCARGDCVCKDYKNKEVPSGTVGCKTEKRQAECLGDAWNTVRIYPLCAHICLSGECGCISEDGKVFTPIGGYSCGSDGKRMKCFDLGWEVYPLMDGKDCPADKPVCRNGECFASEEGKPETLPACYGEVKGSCRIPEVSTCTKNLGRSYTSGRDIIGADYNCDGVVDIADYSVWRKESFEMVPWKGADFWTDVDGSGFIGGDGFSRWRDVFWK
jgi:hypothetical protein